jgi:DNA invertase Pin-like site-specific DNA recombinase
MDEKASRCVIYARYSPRPDEATSDSNDNQIELCRAFAGREGIEVVGVFEDRGKSRDDIERVGIYDAIGALEPGMAMLCLDASRLGSGYVAMMLEFEVMKKGAEVIFADGTRMDKDDPMSMVVRAIPYAYAELQRRMVGPRTSAKMKQHIRNGRKMSGVPVYGYRFEGDRMIENPDEQAVVKQIMQMHNEGMTNYAIAKSLNEQKIPARGKRWHPNSITRILSWRQELEAQQ